MLKRREAAYLRGARRDNGGSGKRDPHIIDAVLMYRSAAHGKRSSYYSDYTFGVWTSGEEASNWCRRQGLFRLH